MLQAWVERVEFRDGVLHVTVNDASKLAAWNWSRSTGVGTFVADSRTIELPIFTETVKRALFIGFEKLRGARLRVIGDARIEVVGGDDQAKRDFVELLRIKRAEWRNLKPLSEGKRRIGYHRHLSAIEWSILASGVLPESMDDKWFVFSEGDRVWIHRSWTGMCMYELVVAERADGAEITDVWVEERPEPPWTVESLIEFLGRYLDGTLKG
jgi:hypothetical protein